MYKFAFAAIFSSFVSASAYSWEGQDEETGEMVEIQKGNLVREGREIEVYDHETGEYHDVEVQNIERVGNSVEVEVYDYETGDTRYLEMED